MSDANTCGVSQIFGAHQRFTAKTGEHQAHQLGAGCLDGETRRERGGGIEIIYAAGFAIGLKQFLNRVAVRRSHWRAKRATSREFLRSSLSLICARWVSTVLGLRCNSFAI